MNLIRPYSLAAALTLALALPVLGQNNPEPQQTLGTQSFAFRETVRHDNLWNISRALMTSGQGVTQQQIMAALLRNNPDAFLNGNVFHLRRGTVLTVPTLADIKAEDPAKAEAFYTGQEKAWLGEDVSPPSLYGLSRATAETPSAVPAPADAKPQESTKPPETAPAQPTSAAETKPADAPRPGLADAPLSGQPDFWKGYWPLLAGAMLLALGLWAVIKRGKEAPATKSTAYKVTKGVAVSMEGLEKTRAVEAMAVAQNLVSSNSTQTSAAPVESHEAQLKLLMAKAYRELKRDQAAREMLEEVIKEGTPDLQDQARKLLAA